MGIAQRTQPVGWVISGVHADPTPALGAPKRNSSACVHWVRLESKPVAVRMDIGLERARTEFEDVPSVLIGSNVIVHRASDSAAFAGWPGLRVPLSSWPALVNGGAVVELKDSLGKVQDALHYSEDDLAGGGRPMLRLNFARMWGIPESGRVVGMCPLSPWLNLRVQGKGHSGNLDSSAADDGRAQAGPHPMALGRDSGPVSRSRLCATVGGEMAGGQLGIGFGGGHSVDGTPHAGRGVPGHPLGAGSRVCTLGAVALPRRRLGSQALMWGTLRPRGGWRILGLDDPRFPEEFIALTNLSDHAVGPQHMGLERRTGTASNTNGPWRDPAVWACRGSAVAWTAERFGPVGGPTSLRTARCGCVLDAMRAQPFCFFGAGGAFGAQCTSRRVVAHRRAAGGSAPPKVVGYGCKRDWSGQWTEVLLHFDRPVGTMAIGRYARWSLVEPHAHPLVKAANRQDGDAPAEGVDGTTALEWPSFRSRNGAPTSPTKADLASPVRLFLWLSPS